MRSVVSIQPRLLAGCLSTAFHVEPTTACSGAATDVRESECMQGKWLPRACIVWGRLSQRPGAQRLVGEPYSAATSMLASGLLERRSRDWCDLVLWIASG